MNETSTSSVQNISHEAISQRAEEIWRKYGSPEGRDEEIWLEAEGQLRSERQQSAVPASENVASKAQVSTKPAQAQSRSLQPTSKEAELMEKNANSTPTKSKSRSSKSR